MSDTVLCALLCIVEGSDKFMLSRMLIQEISFLGTSHPKWRVVPAHPRAAAAGPAHSKNDAVSLPSVASVMHLPCYH